MVVYFPGQLTGKGAGYMACCNPDAVALLAECRVFYEHMVCGRGHTGFLVLTKAAHSSFCCWDYCNSFLCYQYRTFFSSLVLLLHLVRTYTHFYLYLSCIAFLPIFVLLLRVFQRTLKQCAELSKLNCINILALLNTLYASPEIPPVL